MLDLFSNVCMWIKNYLSVECSLVMRLSLLIIFNNHKIRSWTIQWCRITPFTTQVISCPMIDIVIWINYKSSCLLPYIPGSIADTGSKHKTSFVNADVVRTRVFRRVYPAQELQNLGGRLGFCKLGPCNNNTTWSINGLHTVKARCGQVVSLLILRSIFIMRLCTPCTFSYPW